MSGLQKPSIERSSISHRIQVHSLQLLPFVPRADSELLNGARLMRHVLIKGFQAGSVVGIATVLPLLAFRRRRQAGSLASGAVPSLLSAMGTSAVVGVALSGALGAAKVAALPAEERAEGLQDRAYRLHYHQSQNRVDLLSEVGAAVGGSAAMYFVSPAAAVVLGGAAIGAAAGVLTHAATVSFK